jgi:hypothetical protein
LTQDGKKYKGASFIPQSQKWKSQITVEGKVRYLGLFDDAETAARRYDEAASPLGRPVNFPAAGQVAGYATALSKRKDKAGGSKGAMGVSFCAPSGQWKALATAGGKVVFLGLFATEEEAARKCDEASADGTMTVPLMLSRKPPAGDSSKFKGVSFHSQSQKWKAQITTGGKIRYLGLFDKEEDAARKYDEEASAIGRPMNFPGEGQKAVEESAKKKAKVDAVDDAQVAAGAEAAMMEAASSNGAVLLGGAGGADAAEAPNEPGDETGELNHPGIHTKNERKGPAVITAV